MMTGRELVTRALEFTGPERLPFCQGSQSDIPNDVLFCAEMDRQKRGWFLNSVGGDDWGCEWERFDNFSEGQAVFHPLEEWAAFDNFHPPDPLDPYYYERLEPILSTAGDKYVVMTSCLNLNERFHTLRRYENAMMDFYLEPEKSCRLLDMIMEFKIAQYREIHRRFGDRVHAIFLTDDWGTQQGTMVSREVFREFFLPRYKIMVDAAHENGFHFALHSCGRVNDFVPLFIEAGMDGLNLAQPQAYGIAELGEIARGKIAFFSCGDLQKTLPQGNPEAIRKEAYDIIENWCAPTGGLIAQEAMLPDIKPESARLLVRSFKEASEKLGKPRSTE